MRRSLGVLLSALSLLAMGACGAGEDAGLVVCNESAAAVGSVTVYSENSSQTASGASRVLMERGESFGFPMEEGAYCVTVELADPEGRRLARCRLDWDSRREERIYVVLDPDGELVWGGEAVWDRLTAEGDGR